MTYMVYTSKTTYIILYGHNQMQDISSFQKLIESLAPWVIIVVAPFLFWKVPAWKTKIEGKIEKNEENIEKLESKYEKIIDILVGVVGQPVVKRSSPLTLTDYGIAIAEKVDANSIANEYAEKLYSEIETLNAYQIQTFCFDYCRNKLLGDLKENRLNQYEKIHSVAFEDGIEIESITRAIGIKLRDLLLVKKGISHADIIDQTS